LWNKAENHHQTNFNERIQSERGHGPQSQSKKKHKIKFWPYYSSTLNFNKTYQNIELTPQHSSWEGGCDPKTPFFESKFEVKYLLPSNRDFPLLNQITPCQSAILPLSDEDIYELLRLTSGLPSRAFQIVFENCFE
jgi:hypothetical protein